MTDQETKTSEACSCRRKKSLKSKPKASKRKRQTLVHNPDEEVWHEPYMHCLRKEFSQISIPCDSKIELPWKDIALPPVAMKIRAKVQLAKPDDEVIEEAGENSKVELAPKESNGKMNLPWNDLLVMDTVVPPHSLKANGAPCDSTLEIPWDDLALEKPIEIRPIPEEEPCDHDDVEIPWSDILVPANIVIETRKKKKHPSSKAPKGHSGNRKLRNCKDMEFSCCPVKAGRD